MITVKSTRWQRVLGVWQAEVVLAQRRYTLILGFTAGEGPIPKTRPLAGWAMAFLFFGTVLLIDVISPPEVEYSAFYLLPVVWLAWSRGTREGLLMAIIVGVGWYLHDFRSGRTVSSELFRLWEALNLQISFLLAAWLVGTLRREGARQQILNQQLTAALAEVRELKGLLPVCAWCHSIRDEAGDWHTMEIFLANRTRAATTHGICPSCEARLHAEAATLDGPDQSLT
jgi:hypothetical protein